MKEEEGEEEEEEEEESEHSDLGMENSPSNDAEEVDVIPSNDAFTRNEPVVTDTGKFAKTVTCKQCTNLWL